MRIYFLLALLMATGHLMLAQTTSTTSNPDWDANGDWTGSAPGYDSNQSAILDHDSDISGNPLIINNGDIVIINAGSVLTTNETITIKEGGTLIINGTVTGNDSGKELKIEKGTLTVNTGGVLNWAGFWTSDDNPANITIDGSVTVDGDMSNKVTLTGSGSFVVNGTLNNDGGSLFGCTDSGSACCTGGGCVLPIHLLSFDAYTTNENQVLLEWYTASEENNDFFSVKHSENGRDFRLLDKVNGSGNSLSTLKYTYVHTNPAIGLNYYQLSQTDYDGHSETFEPVSIYLKGNQNFRVYPIPATSDQDLTLDLGIRASGKLAICINDLEGREIMNIDHDVKSGTIFSTTIPLESIEPGIYFLTVNGIGVNRLKMIIVE